MDVEAPPLDQLDRRAYLRRPRSLAVQLDLLMAGASPWSGRTCDISPDGIGLVLPRRFEPGTTVSVTFNPGEIHPVTVLGRIARVMAAQNGWLLGCRFSQPVDAEEFGLLLEETMPSLAAVDPVIALPETPSQRVDLRAVREKLLRLGEARKTSENR